MEQNTNSFVIKKSTKELTDVIEYINNTLLGEYPTEKITSEYFLLAILNNEDCYAYRTISQIMLTETIDVLRSWCYKHIAATSNMVNDGFRVRFDNMMLNVFTVSFAKNKNDIISTNDVLYYLLDENEDIRKTFRLLGVTEEEIKDKIFPYKNTDENSDNSLIPVKDIDSNVTEEKKNSKTDKKKNGIKIIASRRNVPSKNDEVEKNLINLNRLASEGKIEEAYENDDVINEIFVNLQKKYKNNVVLVGESGCGKTCTVKHMANMLINGKVPKPFLKKQLIGFYVIG